MTSAGRVAAKQAALDAHARGEKPPSYDTSGNRIRSPEEIAELKRWRNPFWAYAFIACFILYLVGVGYLIQDVLRNNKDIVGDMTGAINGAGAGEDKGAGGEKGKRAVGEEKKGEEGKEGEEGGFDVEELTKGPPKDFNYWKMLTAGTGVGLVSSMFIIFITIAAPAALVWMGYVFLIISLLIQSACMVYSAAYIAAAISGGSALLFTACLFLPDFRKKMKLAAMVLKTVAMIGKKNPSVYAFSIAGVLVEAFFGLLCAAAVVCAVIKFADDSKAVMAGIIVFLLLAQNWVDGTLANILIGTLAGGPYSEWFQEQMPNDYIRNTVLACLARTLTASLGPMAKNAMMVDIVTFVIFLIKVIMWPLLYIPFLGQAILWCVYPILDIFCALLESFNRYVCIVIAVNDYQLDYDEAAKKTYAFAKQGSMRYMGKDAGVADQIKKSWASINSKPEIKEKVERDDKEQEEKHQKADPVGYALHKDRHGRLIKSQHFGNGLGALLNDVLVARALICGSIACALLALMAMYLTIQMMTVGSFDGLNLSEWEWVAAVYAACLAYAMSSVLAKSIEAGVSTLYICIYDPPCHREGLSDRKLVLEILQTKGATDLADCLQKDYPTVMAGVRQEKPSNEAAAAESGGR